MKYIKAIFRIVSVLNEWIYDGVFSDNDTVIIVGKRCLAVLCNIIFYINFPIKVLYVDNEDFSRKYRKKNCIKWIIFDTYKNDIPDNDVLVFPMWKEIMN